MAKRSARKVGHRLMGQVGYFSVTDGFLHQIISDDFYTKGMDQSFFAKIFPYVKWGINRLFVALVICTKLFNLRFI